MLSKTIQAALNEQIAQENYGSNYYLAMAAWCDKSALKGSAKFMYSHAEQERGHMMKLFRYIIDTGGSALVAAVKAPPAEYKNIQEMFELTLKHEKQMTKAINSLVDLCLQEKDYSTFNFLQWYVAEQHEEENQFNRILDLLKITGVDGKGVFFADKEIGSYSVSAK